MENRELPISFDESGSRVEHHRCDYTVRFICYDCRWTLDDCPFFLVTWQLLEELPPCSGSIGRQDCRHNFCFVVTWQLHLCYVSVGRHACQPISFFATRACRC